MIQTIKHDTYGYITYEESFWTGKCTMQLDGKPLGKTGKRTFFARAEDGTEINVSVKGNYMMGVKLNVNGEEVQVVPAIKWYEFALSIFILIFNIVWGNNVVLCSIVPIVSGAIGGLISGACMVFNAVFMKGVKNIFLKLLIFIGMFGLSFLLCYLGALIILSMLI